jgi:hypothetical protein
LSCQRDDGAAHDGHEVHGLGSDPAAVTTRGGTRSYINYILVEAKAAKRQAIGRPRFVWYDDGYQPARASDA